jgi:hypothetical protein
MWKSSTASLALPTVDQNIAESFCFTALVSHLLAMFSGDKQKIRQR